MTTPLSVIGGFLGSGKTTLLNRLLSEAHGVRYAVLVNDFGSLAVDETLVTAHDGDTVSFANGCLCCSLGDNMIETVDRLLERKPDQFLVEASGVANPRAIADMATLHPDLSRDLTVVMADADAIAERDKDERLADTVAMQLQAADLVLLNKCDLANAIDEAEAVVRRHTDTAIVRCTHADIPLDVLDVDAASKAPAYLPVLDHDPDTVFVTETLRLSEQTERATLSSVFADAGALRAKGFVQTETGLCELQVVGKRTAFSSAPEFVDAEQINRVVVIATRSSTIEQVRAALTAQASAIGDRPTSSTR